MHRRRRSRTHLLFQLVTVSIAVIALSLVGLRLWLNYSTTSPRGISTSTAPSATTSSVPTHVTPSEQSQLKQTVDAILESRVGTIEVAVEDLNSGVTSTFGPQNPQDEASVVKVNILAALLATSQTSNPPLTAPMRELAREMIVASDNNAATSLWTVAGGSAGIAAVDGRIGLTSTTPSPCVQCAGFPWPGWGLTTTTPLDQLKLLREIFFDSTFLNSVERVYQLQLMESVLPSERWGISSGVPSTAAVALKNGWLPLNDADTDWQINSVGWVRGNGRDYLIALFSTGNPSEVYGIQTLDAVSAQIWDHLG